MNNPLRVVRESIGMSPADFAKQLGVSRAQVYQAEKGHPIKLPVRFMEGLRTLGVDPAKVSAEYDAYRAHVSPRAGIAEPYATYIEAADTMAVDMDMADLSAEDLRSAFNEAVARIRAARREAGAKNGAH